MTDRDPLRGTDWNDPVRSKLGEKYWSELERFVGACSRDKRVYPSHTLVFAALHRTSLADTRVVIVGQDPYPGESQANGLAFAVPPDEPVPRSLANIYRELHCDVCVPIPNNGDLAPWARRGVLLLNSTLTFRAGASAEHRRMWKPFTNAVIQVAAETDPVFGAR